MNSWKLAEGEENQVWINMNNSLTNSSEDFVYLLQCYAVYYEYPLYGIHYFFEVLIIVVNACIIIPTAMLNSITIYVFTRREQLKTAFNVLLINTSICDLLIGIVGLPLSIHTLVLLLVYKTHNCMVYCANYFTIHLLSWISFITTFCIAVGRYLAIFKPFFYAEKLKGKILPYVLSMLTIWLLMFFVNISSFFVERQLPLMYLSLIIPVVIAYSTYVHVRAHRHLKNIQRSIKAVDEQSDYKANSSTIRESKVARLTSLMLLSLCVCYLPYSGVYMTWIITNKTTHFLDTFGKVSQLFAVVKCLVNPILYYKRKKILRLEVRKILKILFCSSTQRVDSTSQWHLLFNGRKWMLAIIYPILNGVFQLSVDYNLSFAWFLLYFDYIYIWNLILTILEACL